MKKLTNDLITIYSGFCFTNVFDDLKWSFHDLDLFTLNRLPSFTSKSLFCDAQ